MKRFNFDEGLEYAIKLINRFAYTKKTIIDKLRKKNISSIDISKIIAYLTKHNLINDKEFAISYIDQMINRCKGENYIKEKLCLKGISTELISELLSNINKKEILDNLKKKIIYLNNQYKNRDKIIRSCLSSGYYLIDINKIINILIKDSKIKIIKEKENDLY